MSSFQVKLWERWKFMLIPLMVGFVLSTSSVELLAQAKVPDLTKGEKPTPMRKSSKILTGNLGPTGLMGWVYENRGQSDLSRQILITEVAKGSPADKAVKVGDVILGASGKNNQPAKFKSDARRSFANAITDAESKSPAKLSLLLWRKGSTSTVTIKLETMGTYAKEAPFDCPKSLNIIKKALAVKHEKEPKVDRFGLKILALLACDDEKIPGKAQRLKQAQQWILDMFPKGDSFKSMVSDKVETYSKVAWNRTYHLITFAQYYLATGDNPKKGKLDLLTLIDAHAQSVSRGQSMFGTMGHQFALQGEDGSTHGPYGVGYGPINATGLAALLGLTLARDCELPNQKTRKMIEEAIKRGESFFSSFAGRGAIPYGEHPPWTKSHCSNGKSGLAAVAFSRIDGQENTCRYFSQLAIASGAERIGGHGGAFFNYMWSPLGALAGGKEGASAYFKQVRWHLELCRTWDGGFYYNDYGSPGYSGPSFKKASLYMSTPMLLTYGMGLGALNLTGKDWKTSNQLSSADVSSAELAGSYNPVKRSEEELISDLGSFSAVVRNKAATQLSKDAASTSLVEKLSQIAREKSNPSRAGAIKTLGLLGQASSATLLASLLKDQNPLIREAAVEAFGSMPLELQVEQVDTLLKMAASLKRPPMKVNREDPVNTELIALTLMLFEKKGLLG